LIGDSLMCLLIGPLSDEETWAPMKALVRQLSAGRIAQIWLHHTGHDSTRGFGTKTKEWEMDTVAMLSRQDEDGPLALQFTKARLRTPKTAALFKPALITRGENGWTAQPGIFNVAKKQTDRERKRTWFLKAYSDLAAITVTVDTTTGRRFVRIDDIRDYMAQHGYLATEDGAVPHAERTAFWKAKQDLIGTGHFASDGTWFWEEHPV
jgi:hypothetical protein